METPNATPRPRPERCTTPDGLDLAVYEFGGHGPDIVLVHATGFCAATLGPLAHNLGRHHRCWGLDLRGHGRSDRPPDGNFAWTGFATDVLTVIDHLGLDQPSGFGHACGGAAILLAEEARPGTFRSMYCFEPVVMPDSARAFVMKKNPLAEGARRRRETFPSAADAFVNFSSKPPFSDLDPEALRLYIDGGFEIVPSDAGGDGLAIRLRCRREDESVVYAEAAHHEAFSHLHAIGCPVTVSCGELTDAFGPPLRDAVADQLPDARVETLIGMGHFGPLQQPPAVAASVLRAMGTVRGTPPS